jgi:hypothetical protein
LTNKPKMIGTRAETLVVTVARRNGFHYARRNTLAGALDVGDIHLGDGTDTIIEVKGGKQCVNLQPAKMAKWIAETRAEAKNANARIAFLVTQRAGYGLGNGEKWYAHIPWEYYEEMAVIRPPGEYVTLELGDALRLVKDYLDIEVQSG